MHGVCRAAAATLALMWGVGHMGGGVLALHVSHAVSHTVSPAAAPIVDATSSMEVPGGVEALARVAGIDPGQPRSRVVLTLVRVMYELPAGFDKKADARRKKILDYLVKLELERRPGAARPTRDVGPNDTVPMAMPASVLPREDGTSVANAPYPLVRILADRDLALTYYGLSALDVPTRQFLADNPDLIRALRLPPVSAIFALYGRSIQIRDGRVITPGGDALDAVWQRLAGVRPGSPASFVKALLQRDEGRLAYFYDTVAHLDRGRQAFVLAPGAPDARLRADAILDTYEASAPAMAAWNPIDRPFARVPFDFAHLISALTVDTSGRLAPPASPTFWHAVFTNSALERGPGSLASVVGESGLDAAALLRLVSVSNTNVRRSRSHAFLFAQRVFSRADASEFPDIFATLRDFARYEALDLAIERMGITRPTTYAAATARARFLLGIGNRQKAGIALSQFQGAAVLVERARINRSIDAATADQLVASLSRIGLVNDEYRGAIGTWIVKTFLPASAPIVVPAGHEHPDRPIEDQVLAAMSGCGGSRAQKADAAPLSWEGLEYTVDPAQANFVRLAEVRIRQGGQSLDAALVSTSSDASASANQVDGQLAAALMSIAYAPAIGDPDGPTLLGGDPSRLHDFGLDLPSSSAHARAAFIVPSETRDPSRGWHLTGSVFDLDVALPYLTLRRVASDALAEAPTAGETDRRGFAEVVPLMNSFDQTDAARTSVLHAIERGRQVVATLSASAGTQSRLASLAGLDEWRAQALPWLLVNEPAQLDDIMSIGEVARLGLDGAIPPAEWDQWGTSSTALDGRLGVRFPDCQMWTLLSGRSSTLLVSSLVPDLSLGLAEQLAAIGLPARLTQGVAAVATQDLLDQLHPDFDDDWISFVSRARRVARDRFDDYVAALTNGGPLVPVRKELPDGIR